MIPSVGLTPNNPRPNSPSNNVQTPSTLVCFPREDNINNPELSNQANLAKNYLKENTFTSEMTDAQIMDLLRDPNHLKNPNLFIDSASNNDIEVINLFIAAKADLGVQNLSGQTALMVAVLAGAQDVVEILIEADAHVNLLRNNEKTAFMSALEKGLEVVQTNFRLTKIYFDIATLFLEKFGDKLDPNVKIQGQTALTAAIRIGAVGFARALIKAGADVNIPDDTGSTPLILALQRKSNTRSLNIANLLIKGGAKLNPNNNIDESILADLMIKYVQLRNIDIIQFFINEKIDLNLKNKSGETALTAAVSASVVAAKIVKILIQAGADLYIKNASDKHTLGIAIVVLLAEAMIKKRPEDTTHIINCFKEKIGLNFQNSLGITVLMCAAYADAENVVRALFKYPALDINLQDSLRSTALMYAAYAGAENVVRALLERPDLRINLQNSSKFTALMCAAYAGAENVVRALLEHPDLDINLKDSSGSTALILSVKNGYFIITKKLLDKKNVQPNFKSDTGKNAISNIERQLNKYHSGSISHLEKKNIERIKKSIFILTEPIFSSNKVRKETLLDAIEFLIEKNRDIEMKEFPHKTDEVNNGNPSFPKDISPPFFFRPPNGIKIEYNFDNFINK